MHYVMMLFSKIIVTRHFTIIIPKSSLFGTTHTPQNYHFEQHYIHDNMNYQPDDPNITSLQK